MSDAPPTTTGSDDAVAAGLISKRVVQLLSERTGRGATKVRTWINDELVTVVLQDVLTKGERNLADAGHDEPVLESRRAYAETMADEMVAIVEELTGSKVAAYLSANHLDPDIEIESFVLERATRGTNADTNGATAAAA
ncbi:MAG: Na-translocating system protein MpsC family protein [Solirubrobacteraceae bacterium]|nr:Na-translocating system protein MpsC family protein [Patulibacter sp.]